jgi:uncharacterized tellurite resistance protein B-like protein
VTWLVILLILFFYFGGHKFILWMFANSTSASREPPILSGTPISTMQLTDGFEPNMKMPCKRVHFKGPIPITRDTEITFVLSAVDITDEGARPCLFPFDAGQEKDTLAFQFRRPTGVTFSPGQYLRDWVEAGIIFPSLLQPPFGGTRKIQAVLRLIEKGKEDIIKRGFCKDGIPGLLWAGAKNFEFEFTEKGYEEEKIHRREALLLAIHLAMAVSSADGCFDEEEGEVVQAWIERHIESARPSERESLKKDMNASVQKAYQDGIETGIQTDQAIARLNEIGDKATKFEALELCFEVMSANDKISPDEMNFIRTYANLLNIPSEEFERLKDFHTLNVTLAENPENDDERLLGIDPAWSKEEKLIYLRKEFKKWNSRMATLTDPEQRKVAQHRLDMIGRIRQRYETEETS